MLKFKVNFKCITFNQIIITSWNLNGFEEYSKKKSMSYIFKCLLTRIQFNSIQSTTKNKTTVIDCYSLFWSIHWLSIDCIVQNIVF